MPTPSYDSVRRVFDAVIAAPAGERGAILDRQCAGDARLRQRIEAMVSAAEDERFLAEPTRPGTDSCPTADSAGGAGAASAEAMAGTGHEGPGSRIGPYRILELIGEGGFGSVFMAEQEVPVARRVALKIIKLGMDTRQVVARFEQERQALAMMDHPNIARVLDAGATGAGRPYFVMELVKGDPIAEYADKHSLTIPERLTLFEQVCNAVQHAHTKGVIHRDIKPSNVLVSTHDGRPHAKVIDFGIAKATASKLTERTLFTEHRQLIGTPEYMSPEQAEGSLDIDTRTDVYSLGVLLYELLTGTTPFSSRELRSAAYAEIQRIIREVDPPRPSTRLSDNSETLASVAARRRIEPRRLGTTVRGELDWIVMKALEKDRQRRYEGPSGLAADIGRYLRGEAVVAAPASTGYRIRKFVRRHRGPVLAGGVVAAALVAGVVGTSLGMLQADRARAAERQRADGESIAKREAVIARTEALEQKASAEAQAAEARRQAAIASAVVKFQAELLSAVDPYKLPLDPVTGEPMRDRVTVLQAVEAARARIDEGALKDDPLVEAGVRTTIGDTLAALGRLADAVPQLRRALELRVASYPEASPEVAQSMDRLAGVLGTTGALPEAERLLREGLAIRRRVLRPDDPSIGVALNNLSTVLQLAGRLDESEALLREAITLLEGKPTASPADLSRTYDNLAKVLTLRRKLPEAELLMRRALTTRLASFPPGHPEVSLGKNNLAVTLMSARKYDEAEALLRESLAEARSTLPAGHPELASKLLNLGGVLRRRGKLAESEKAYREALEIGRATLPPEHERISTSLNGLGGVLGDLGRPDEAEALFREAVALRRAALGPGHPALAVSLTHLGSLLRSTGKHEQAEPVFREALAIRRAALAADHPDLTRSVLNLAGAAEKLGKPDEARPLLDEAIANLRKSAPDGSQTLALALWRAGTVRMGSGDPAGALPLLEECVRMAERHGKPDSDQLREFRATLAACRAAVQGAEPGPGAR